MFDAPESSVSCPRRDATTVAPQALALFNGRFMLQQAGALAQRLEKQHPEDPSARVNALWQLALSRSPSPAEMDQARSFLTTGSVESGQASPLAQLCIVVLNMNEFLYVE